MLANHYTGTRLPLLGGYRDSPQLMDHGEFKEFVRTGDRRVLETFWASP